MVRAVMGDAPLFRVIVAGYQGARVWGRDGGCTWMTPLPHGVTCHHNNTHARRHARAHTRAHTHAHTHQCSLWRVKPACFRRRRRAPQGRVCVRTCRLRRQPWRAPPPPSWRRSSGPDATRRRRAIDSVRDGKAPHADSERPYTLNFRKAIPERPRNDSERPRNDSERPRKGPTRRGATQTISTITR